MGGQGEGGGHGRGGGDSGDGEDAGDADDAMEGVVPAIGVCANCGTPVSEGTVRVFYEVPTCPDCFHALGLMKLALVPGPEEDALLARAMCDGIGPLSIVQRLRMTGLAKFAGLLPQTLGGELVASAAAASGRLDSSGIIRTAIAARAVARDGTDKVRADGGTVNVLLHLASLLIYELAIAAMVRAGVVRRGPMGEEGEWQYEYLEEPGAPAGGAESAAPAATAPGGDRASFAPYARDLRDSGDALLADLEGLPGVDPAHVAKLRARLAELLRT